MTEYILGLSLI